MQLHAATATYIVGADLLKRNMKARASEPGVIGLKHPLRIALADRRRVCVHGVQKELHGDGVAPLQVAGVVVRNDNSSVDAASTDGIAELADRSVVADQPKALALGQRSDQLPAVGSSTVVYRSEFDISYGGAQGKSQEEQLQRGRQNQRERQAAVALDLGHFLADKSADTVIEES